MHFNEYDWREVAISTSLMVVAGLFLASGRAHADEFFLCQGRTVVVTELNRALVRDDPCVRSWLPARWVDSKTTPGYAPDAEVAEARMLQLATFSDVNAEARPVRSATIRRAAATPPAKIVKATSKQRSPKAHKAHTMRPPVRGMRYYGDGIWAQ